MRTEPIRACQNKRVRNLHLLFAETKSRQVSLRALEWKRKGLQEYSEWKVLRWTSWRGANDWLGSRFHPLWLVLSWKWGKIGRLAGIDHVLTVLSHLLQRLWFGQKGIKASAEVTMTAGHTTSVNKI